MVARCLVVFFGADVRTGPEVAEPGDPGWSQRQAEAWPGWRSPRERAHVYAQFDEARAVYKRFATEAPGAGAGVRP